MMSRASGTTGKTKTTTRVNKIKIAEDRKAFDDFSRFPNNFP